MNQYTKRKLNEALSLTQNEINTMPTDKLYEYVDLMNKVQIDKYAAGLHAKGSGAVDRYTGLGI